MIDLVNDVLQLVCEQNLSFNDAYDFLERVLDEINEIVELLELLKKQHVHTLSIIDRKVLSDTIHVKRLDQVF